MAAIMAIEEVPYGNAEINVATQTVTCQHGPDECLLNEYEQCGIYLYPDQTIWLPFLVCMEEHSNAEAMIASVPGCASNAGMDAAKVEACQKDPALTWQLQQAAAATTAAADHSYTPWVVVNGQLLQHDFQFKSMICNAYTGTLPPACPNSAEAIAEKKCNK